MSEQILSYKDKTPEIAEDVFIAPGSYVIGDVSLASCSSVWFGCTLRGDDVKIVIGEGTNIQDGVVIHGDEGEVLIGKNVTVGHGVVLHGCDVHDNALIGMGAVVLDGAVVESGAMVAAGAVVSPGKRVIGGTLWAGVPAREIKKIDTQEMKDMFLESAEEYQQQAKIYLSTE
ncbi:MAG: gamma carbonic anhydrase family protein [Gammaproteobacteria bacterium]|nr:MAG: gamma carbonic anhydrase family protein [Gammaproteobacteria bacterium]